MNNSTIITVDILSVKNINNLIESFKILFEIDNVFKIETTKNALAFRNECNNINKCMELIKKFDEYYIELCDSKLTISTN